MDLKDRINLLNRKDVFPFLDKLNKEKTLDRDDLPKLSPRNYTEFKKWGIIESSRNRVVDPDIKKTFTRKVIYYHLNENGQRIMNLYDDLAKTGSEGFLRIKPHHMETLRFVKEKGKSRHMDIRGLGFDTLIANELLTKKTEEEEVEVPSYTIKFQISITEKGNKLCELIDGINRL